MNEPLPTLGSPAGASGIAEEVQRLSLMVQRIVDADLLPSDEGAALLAETAAARQALENGDETAARLHLGQLVGLTEVAINCGVLDFVDGRAVIEVANGIRLNSDLSD